MGWPLPPQYKQRPMYWSIPKLVNMNKTLMLLKQPDRTCKACLSSVAALACCDAFLSSFCSAVDFLREDFSDLYLSLSLACSSSCTTGDQYSLMLVVQLNYDRAE